MKRQKLPRKRAAGGLEFRVLVLVLVPVPVLVLVLVPVLVLVLVPVLFSPR